MKKLLLFLTVLMACGRHGVSDEPTQPSMTLSEVRAVYMDLIPSVQDVDGYVDIDECDSVLHTALLGSGGVPIAHMNAARNDNDQWFRRPLTYPECLASGGSKSTISRDMIVGLMWYWYTVRDLNAAERFYKYASDRALKFGESDGTVEGNSRIYMTPYLMSLLSELIFRLGGENHVVWRATAARLGADVEGFEAHLHTLTTILWGRLTGFYTGGELAYIKVKAENTENALFQYAAEDYVGAEATLLRQHPHNQLPTSIQMCNPMPYANDIGKMGPETCPKENRTHAGIHFMLISKWLIDQCGGDTCNK